MNPTDKNNRFNILKYIQSPKIHTKKDLTFTSWATTTQMNVHRNFVPFLSSPSLQQSLSVPISAKPLCFFISRP